MKKLIVLISCAMLAGAVALCWFLFGGRLLAWYYSTGADSALAAGQSGQAAMLLERELALYPRDEELRLRVAELYIEDGNYSRAEYHLAKGVSAYPSAALYRRLCAVYVAQDKLYDAVELLGGIPNAQIAAEIDAARPAAPVFSHASGVYEESITVALDVTEGCAAFVSWRGEIPSAVTERYAESVKLPPGETVARALAVDGEGLVSVWALAEYRLENIVEPLIFADPAVESLIREAIARPDGQLYSSDLWPITQLQSDTPTAYGTLSDLVACTGLQTLSLMGQDTACDLSALPLLTGLTELRLPYFRIDSVDLEIIGRMTTLEKLDLEGNRISGLDNLSGLTGLRELNLSDNNLLDVDALSGLTALRILDISGGAVQDLRPLAGLTALEELFVSQNRVTALTGLEGMAKLRRLDAGYNYIDTISPAAKLGALEELLLGHNALDALPSLGQLKGLRTLDLSCNLLTSVGALEGLSALENLQLNENALDSLQGLEMLDALTELNISKNNVTSVGELKNLPALVTLRAEHNKVKTLLPLKSCPALKTVFAFDNPLTDPIDAFVGTGITVNRG